jgi:hypothetical protein
MHTVLRVGDEALKPIKEALGEEYTYDEIRLVRAYMRATTAQHEE